MKELNLMCFVINVITLLMIAITLGVIPLITRKSLLFGVRVPESVQKEAKVKRLKQNYMVVIIIGAIFLLFIAILQYLFLPTLTLIAVIYLPLLMLVLQFTAFIPQWKKAKLLKEQNGWNVTATRSVETSSAVERVKLSSIPWGFYIASIIICTIVAIWTMAIYPSIPNIIITHWNADMQPDVWSHKSIMAVMIMPIIALSIVAIMIFSNIAVMRMKLQISTENPALSFAQHRVYRKMLSSALGFLTICITIIFILFQPMKLNVLTISSLLILVATVAIIVLSMVPFLYIAIKVGQSGCKLKPPVSRADMEAIGYHPESVRTINPGRGDDRYWKMGLFYYNKDDPAILVEDRFGGNGGFNYARLTAKIFVIVIGIATIAAYAVTTVIFMNLA